MRDDSGALAQNERNPGFATRREETPKQSAHGIIAFVIALLVLATPAWYLCLFRGKPHAMWLSVVLYAVGAVYTWQASKEQGFEGSYGWLAFRIYRAILILALVCVLVIVLFIILLMILLRNADFTI